MAENEKTPCNAEMQNRETKRTSLLYQHAYNYANRGWRVLPLFSNKKPRTDNGWKDGTTDQEQIREWWTRWPDANIGIVTGDGLMVIDLDVNHGDVDGTVTLNEWEREHGELPATVTANTGNGGTHYYYAVDDDIKGINRCAEFGVDVKAAGGYVVAPPSVNSDNAPYVWEYPPEEVEIAHVDDRVMAFLAYVGASNKREKHTGTFQLPSMIPIGTRNETLFSFAASLQARGFSDDKIALNVNDANEVLCETPLDAVEVDKILASVLEYPKGTTSTPEDGKKSKVGNITKIEQLFDRTCLRDAFATNDFDGRIYIRNVVPWSDEANRLYDKELDFAHIRKIILDDIGRVDKESIVNAISITGNKTHFDSVIDMLAQLPPWDGKEHVGHLFNKILGAEDTPYTRAVETILFNGLVMRQYHPGCKFDYIPVLIGMQGIGKSKFAEKLALDEEYFTDTPIDPRDKEVGRYVRGRIVVEIPELSGFKGKDAESIKAFVTRRYDDFRKLYVDDVVKHPRRFVLIGTTNEDHFLKDITGNRRFLPIYCGVCDPEISILDDEAIDKEVRQAWAEMLCKKAYGELPLVLDDEAQAAAKRFQDDAMREDPRIGQIEEWLHKRELSCPDERICALNIICELLEYDRNNYPSYLPDEIHNIMKSYFPQWKYVSTPRTVTPYGQQRYYIFEKDAT